MVLVLFGIRALGQILSRILRLIAYVCAIRFPFADLDSSLTVISVYLPCLEQGIDLIYRQHLEELEMVISKSLLLGGVMVLGDFNAHLGRMGVNAHLGRMGQKERN